jgi:hypothetical protein
MQVVVLVHECVAVRNKIYDDDCLLGCCAL